MNRIAAWVIASTCLAAPVSAQQPTRDHTDTPVVIATGQASVKRAPDRAWVTIATESRAKSPREAQKMNADAMSAVMQKLKGSSLASDAIRTLQYELQPDIDYREGRQTVRGYIARNMIEVRVDEIAKAGEIVELAVSAGATNVGGIRFDLKDRAAAERDALSRAVADARARAEAAATGAGMRLDKILRIQEQRAFEPMPMANVAMMAAERAGGEPPITPGELEIRAMVTVTASIIR